MATLAVDILTRAARQCSVAPPSNWTLTSDDEHLELIDFMHETAINVLERVDWATGIAKEITLVGVGAPGDFSLGADYLRLVRGPLAVHERTMSQRACIPVTSDGQWQKLQDDGAAGGDRYYRLVYSIVGVGIEFYMQLEVGSEVTVNYISKNWLAIGSTGYDAFDNVEQLSILPREVMETGIIWRFRRRRGLPYADVQAEHDILLSRHSNDSRGRNSVTFGRPRARWPFDVPIPDYIPPA